MRYFRYLLVVLITSAFITSIQGQAPGAGVMDVDGNTYPTVIIGTQEWMAANLRTTRYRTGATITNVTNATTWTGLTTGAWAHYDNNSANETVYGKLYNWYAVADSRNICPTGWHVPSDAEWTVLSDFLATDVGFKMKSTSGWVENGNGSNASGFNGLPGGWRIGQNGGGTFNAVGSVGYFWSSSELNSDGAWYRLLSLGSRDLLRPSGLKRDGFSVRCVRPLSTSTESGFETPLRTELMAAYPNPFNPSTQIRFTLDAGRQTRLAVYDMLGREVAVLVNGSLSAGSHQVTFDASGLASGVYIYRLEAGGEVFTRRMTLVK